MIPPVLLQGESWETRYALDLQPMEHYYPLSPDPNQICADIINMVRFLRHSPMRAKQMAYKSRQIALDKLNKQAVLRDFALILLEYGALYQQGSLSG